MKIVAAIVSILASFTTLGQGVYPVSTNASAVQTLFGHYTFANPPAGVPTVGVTNNQYLPGIPVFNGAGVTNLNANAVNGTVGNAATAGTATIALGGYGLIPNSFNPSNTVLVIDGDSLSITNAYSSGLSWPQVFTNLPGWSGFLGFTNTAMSGYGIGSALNKYDSAVHPWAPSPGTNGILFFWLGVNDGVYGVPFLIPQYSNYWFKAHQDGFKIAVATVPPGTGLYSNGGIVESNRWGLNQYFKTSNIPDYVVEVDRRMPNNNDGMYYNLQDGGGTSGTHMHGIAMTNVAWAFASALSAGPHNSGYSSDIPTLYKSGTNWWLRDTSGSLVLEITGSGQILMPATGGIWATSLLGTVTSSINSTQFWGQLNPSNFNNGTGAGPTTYLRGDGTWFTPSTTGNVASANSSIIATNFPSGNPLSSGAVFVTWDGGGSIVTSNKSSYLMASYPGTITGWSMLTDVPSNVILDIWKTNNATPTSATSITGSAKPILGGTSWTNGATLTGWTNGFQATDVFGFNIISNSAAKVIQLQLQVTR